MLKWGLTFSSFLVRFVGIWVCNGQKGWMMIYHFLHGSFYRSKMTVLFMCEFEIISPNLKNKLGQDWSGRISLKWSTLISLQ